MYNNDSNKLAKLLTEEDVEMYNIVNIVFITSTLCLMGVVTNVINIVVFYRQGFASTMNISFFGLAISDLCSLLTLLFYCIWVSPWLANSDVPMASCEVLYLATGLPHICFARITGWITVYITAERCLCIIIPLKIKQIITPRTVAVTLCIIYLINFCSFLPEYATVYLGWKFYPEKNRTLMGVVFTRNRKSVDGLVFILYSVLGLVTFVSIIVFTVVLVVQLKEKSKWRKKANVEKSASESISIKERKSVMMVVMITTILIVCYIPGVTISLATFFETRFSISGQYLNTYLVTWSFGLVFDGINSSVNICLYYKMSSKYRETFNKIFGISGVKSVLVRLVGS